MSLLEAIILGIVQGAAEFLPISSSGHLVLVPWWLGWDQPPLIYVVAVHLGTASAILLYFWRDWLALTQAGLSILRKRKFETTDERLLMILAVGTLPAAFIGFFLDDFFEDRFSDPPLVAAMLFVTAALLLFSEWYSQADRKLSGITFLDGLFIGFAQALAIMPGISRSGSTIAAGQVRHLNRDDAARYSFLLATPIILAAGAKQVLDVITGDVSLDSDLTGALIAGFVVSAVVGYGSIAFLLSFIRQQSLRLFAAYCVLFGTASLILAAVR